MLVNRIVQFVVVLILVTFGTTMLINLTPGSPCYLILGSFATNSAVASCEKAHGYNLPILEQYWHWVRHAVHGDLGQSVQAQTSVVSVIKHALPISLEISLLAFVASLIVGVVLAVLSAIRAGGVIDRICTALTALFIALPPIVSVPFYLLVFSLWLHAFPPSGWVGLTTSLSENLRHVAIPVIALTVIGCTLPLRVLRGDLATVLTQDFIAAARARGLPERTVLIRHALRPASVSLLTVSGLLFGYLFTGNIIVETFFSAPGIGYQASFAVGNHDVPVVQGVVVVASIAYMLINLVVDFSYPILDPRLRSSLGSPRTVTAP